MFENVRGPITDYIKLLNYLKYFQLIAAIPNYLKRKAQATAVSNKITFEEWDIFHLSKNKAISLTKCKCKDYYKLFQEKIRTEPTAVKRWCRRFKNFNSIVGNRFCTKFTKREE